MAPKRARLFRGGSSSGHQSSDSDSSLGAPVEKFQTPAARAIYERLMTKSVAKDRLFLVGAGDGDILQMIQDRGWQGICEILCAIPLSIVREFYAHAKERQDGYSTVRGFAVDYTPEAIRRILRLPERPAGAEDWTFKSKAEVDLDAMVARLCVPGTVWKMTLGTPEHAHFPALAMNKYARAWNLFICANVLPSSHSHDVTVERAILLWAILNGHYIDLGYLISQNMLRYLRSGMKGSIPYGSIITSLCTDVGVQWPADEQLQMPSGAIDSSSIERMVEWPGGIPHPRGLGYEIAGGGEPHARAADDGAGLSASQFRRMTRRMDALYDSHSRFSQELTQALGSAFGPSGASIAWPVFGAHTVYPPPDSPEQGDAGDE